MFTPDRRRKTVRLLRDELDADRNLRLDANDFDLHTRLPASSGGARGGGAGGDGGDDGAADAAASPFFSVGGEDDDESESDDDDDGSGGDADASDGGGDTLAGAPRRRREPFPPSFPRLRPQASVLFGSKLTPTLPARGAACSRGRAV